MEHLDFFNPRRFPNKQDGFCDSNYAPIDSCINFKMNLFKENFGKPIQIVISFLVLVSMTLILSLQVELFAEYASKHKPYSILFTKHIYKGLEDDHSLKIIYLGDSTLFFPPHFRADEGDGSNHTPVLLGDILSARAPRLDVGISEWAFGSAQMYHYYCMLNKALDFSPDLVIIPINWNSFGPIWTWLSKDEFPELCALVPLYDSLSPETENPLRMNNISRIKQLGHGMEMLTLYPIGFKEWARDNLLHISKSGIGDKVSDDKRNCVNNVRSSDKEYLQNAYPLEISRADKNLTTIHAIAELAHKNDIPILFYLTPINVEHLERTRYMRGEAFEESKRTIMETVVSSGCYYVDLSEILNSSAFCSIFPNEHYLVDGRKTIAEALAPKVIEILSERAAKNYRTEGESGLYTRKGNGVRPIVSPNRMDLLVRILRPYFYLQHFLQRNGFGIHDSFAKKSVSHFFEELQGGSTDTIRERSIRSFLPAYHPLTDEEKQYWVRWTGKKCDLETDAGFKEMLNMCRLVQETGSRLVFVDVPVAEWHKQLSPAHQSYKERKGPYLKEALQFSNVRYINLQDTAELADEPLFIDGVHPREHVSEMWSRALKERWDSIHLKGNKHTELLSQRPQRVHIRDAITWQEARAIRS